jgi:beta-lactamase superfamily II metal-dependent hydrolase
MPERKEPIQGTLPPPNKGVIVRMYHTGFGDCFLLSFRGQDKKARYMLIDCGVHKDDERGPDRMKLIAEDIAKATGGKIDIVAITHQHADHLYGFKYAEDTFKNGIKINELWLPWTEDPTNTTAQALKELCKKKIAALQAAITKLKAASSPLAPSLEGILNFELSAEDALGLKGNVDILEFLRAKSLKKLEKPDDYLTPNMPAFELRNVKGIKIYVLGPPPSVELIKILERKAEMYPKFTASNARSAFTAALTAVSDAGSPEGQPLSPLTPFDKSFSLSKDVAGEHPAYKKFFKEHYGLDETAKSAPEWRRIETDWLDSAGELALSINNMTNNTSLVLAIELTGTKSRKVLLFAADAQVGNWLSWQSLKWSGEKEDEVVTGGDLLKRTVFYKVGHHGSRNATLREKGLEMMESNELVAFIPVDAEWAKKEENWNHPEKPIVDALQRKTRGRVIRSDEIPTSGSLSKPVQLTDGEWKAFFANLDWDKSENRLWIQYTVR